MLSPEALWQLNQNCVLAPSGLDLLLSNAEMSYPEFHQRYVVRSATDASRTPRCYEIWEFSELCIPDSFDRQRYQSDFRTMRDIVGKLRDDIKNCGAGHHAPGQGGY